jgi:hypothetical protein
VDVQIINWSGALIGPGSEWFWSMLQFVIVAATLIGLYRQLRLQSSATAFQQLREIVQEWGSERLLRCRVELLRALRDGTDPANLPKGVGVVLLDYWETVGLLVRDQHVSRRLVWEDFGNVCQTWWVILKPYINVVREQEGDAMIGEHFEWLAGVMANLDSKVASPPVYDHAFVFSTLDARLSTAADTLRLVRSLRAPVKPEAL